MAEPKLNFAHLCDYAFFSDMGKLNIMGIFKSINAQKFPAVHPQMFVVTNISIEKGKSYEGKIKLKKKSDGKQIGEPIIINFSLPFSGGDLKAEISFIGQVNGVSFDEAGEYFFEIYVGETLIGELPFQLNKI